MYKKMYTTLFNAITDVLNDLPPDENSAFRLRLVEAQRQTEEIFMDLSAQETEN